MIIATAQEYSIESIPEDAHLTHTMRKHFETNKSDKFGTTEFIDGKLDGQKRVITIRVNVTVPNRFLKVIGRAESSETVTSNIALRTYSITTPVAG